MHDTQADVPSAKGFRRNLRSKTRWFTGFCNSHQVSHFTTFFIDARAKISVAESHYKHFKMHPIPLATTQTVCNKGVEAFIVLFYLARIAPGFVSPQHPSASG